VTSDSYVKISKELQHVKSSRELKKFLEQHIEWNILVQQPETVSISRNKCSTISESSNVLFSGELCDNCHNDSSTQIVDDCDSKRHTLLPAFMK